MICRRQMGAFAPAKSSTRPSRSTRRTPLNESSLVGTSNKYKFRETDLRLKQFKHRQKLNESTIDQSKMNKENRRRRVTISKLDTGTQQANAVPNKRKRTKSLTQAKQKKSKIGDSLLEKSKFDVFEFTDDEDEKDSFKTNALKKSLTSKSKKNRAATAAVASFRKEINSCLTLTNPNSNESYSCSSSSNNSDENNFEYLRGII